MRREPVFHRRLAVDKEQADLLTLALVGGSISCIQETDAVDNKKKWFYSVTLSRRSSLEYLIHPCQKNILPTEHLSDVLYLLPVGADTRMLVGHLKAWVIRSNNTPCK